MKIKQKDIEKLLGHFEKWKGASASINSYRDDHDRLIVALERSNKEFIGICFTYCVFLCGPLRWQNCNLSCELFSISEGEMGFEVRDIDNGFSLRCEGPIVVGDNELIVPQS